jgi:hypothetical protein
MHKFTKSDIDKTAKNCSMYSLRNADIHADSPLKICKKVTFRCSRNLVGLPGLFCVVFCRFA